MNALGDTLRAYSVMALPAFCVICEGELRPPENVVADSLTGKPAHKDCTRRPRRAFDLIRGRVFPAARRYLPEPRS